MNLYLIIKYHTLFLYLTHKFASLKYSDISTGFDWPLIILNN